MSKGPSPPKPVAKPAPPKDKKMAGGLARNIMRRTRGQLSTRMALVLGPPVAWMALFLLVPMIVVFIYGFATVDPNNYQLTFSPPTTRWYGEVLDPDEEALSLLVKTFGVAGLQTLLSLVVGYAIAYYVARLAKESRRGIIMSLIVIPFWVSFVVRIFGLFAFSQPAGFMAVGMRSNGFGFLADFMIRILEGGTLHMLIFTLMYVWIPFMILPLFTSLSKLDPLVLEAAYDLGASRMRAFFWVTLPLTFPGIITGSILTFITSVGAFVESEMVGGTDWLLIGNYVYTQFNSPVGLPRGAAAAVLIMVSTLALIVFYTRYSEAQDTGEIKKSKLWAGIRARLVPRKIPSPAKPATPPVKASMSLGPMAADGGTAVVRVPVGGVPRSKFEKTLDALVERLGKPVLGFVTYFSIIILFVPLLLVAVFSFNNAQDSFGTWQGFSLRWYLSAEAGSAQENIGLFADRDVMSSLINSIIVGIGSAFFALIFGLMAAYAITRFSFRFKDTLKSVMYLGLVIPSIVLGISIAILIKFLNGFVLGPVGFLFTGTPGFWEQGLASIIVGHTTFNIPLATLVLLISFREFDRSLEEAAMNLGADELTTFFKVTIPNIMPGIVSALLLAFTFSFDELPVTVFLKGQGVETLPVVIYGMISKKMLTPKVNAASTFILILSVIFVIAANKVQRGGTIFRF